MQKTKEWEVCPKCNGSGFAMNFTNPIPTYHDQCDVCNGKKIISSLTGLPPQTTGNKKLFEVNYPFAVEQQEKKPLVDFFQGEQRMEIEKQIEAVKNRKLSEGAIYTVREIENAIDYALNNYENTAGTGAETKASLVASLIKFKLGLK